jgi:LAO/AO transport system kinase
MLHMDRDPTARLNTGHHDAPEHPDAEEDEEDGEDEDEDHWEPKVLETVAKNGEGVEELIESLDAHSAWLDDTGRRETKARQRYAAEIRQLLRSDAADLVEAELERHGGVGDLADRVLARETDPYTVADEVLRPVEECVENRRED